MTVTVGLRVTGDACGVTGLRWAERWEGTPRGRVVTYTPSHPEVQGGERERTPPFRAEDLNLGRLHPQGTSGNIWRHFSLPQLGVAL